MSYPLFYEKDAKYTAIPGWIYNAITSTPEKGTMTWEPLKIVSAKANTSETGNGPENTIDNDSQTRWSAQGIGTAKITFDLGGDQTVGRLEVEWYKGEERRQTVDLLLNDVFYSTFTSDLSATISNFPLMSAQRAKTVSLLNKGNTANNDWISIVGVRLFGHQDTAVVPSTPSTPIPVPSPPPPSPVPPPPPPTAIAGLDIFGTKMIYPTVANGRVFNAPFKTGSQRTLSSNQRDGNSDLIPLGSGKYTIYPDIGEMKMEGSAPRLYVYDAQRSKPFENVEITCYYKSVSTTSAIATGYQGFELGVRGQHELAGTNARVYYARHSLNGTWWRMKEDVHPTSKDVSVKTGVAFTKGVWYGMKHIVRNVGTTGVRLEAFRDTTDGKNGGTWELMSDFTDKQSALWAGYPLYKMGTPNCACRSAFARTDNSVDFRLKKFSIREIAPLP